MIAAGICLMGGCFAQNEDFSLAEGYWPCEYVGIPSSPSSMALYEYSVVPEGVDIADCFVFTRQVAHTNYISSFFVFQNNKAALNCYISKASVGTVLEVATNTPELGRKLISSYPVDVEFFADEHGARCLQQGIETGPCLWNSSLPGSRLRLLDVRQGKKDFYTSYGQWGYKWYLLPMRSVLNTEAVFDFEGRTLIEL